jgi:DNA-binding CsgD family transcriptional regulator
VTDVDAGNGLVERETELELITQLLGSARAGAGGIALVEADAGLGKSRLVTAAAAAAEATGMEVLRARGRELERGFPFGLATQLLEQHWDGPQSDGVAAMLADGRGSRGPSHAASDEEYAAGQTYAAIHRLYGLVKGLSARPGAPALAVIVDDVHHADPSSLRFLAYLAARISDLRLALILVTGTDVPAGDERILSALRAAAGAAVLRPRALTAAGVASVVRSYVPDADGGLCELCGALTQGNPLLLTELLAQLSRAEAGPATPTSQLVRDLSSDSWRRIVSLRLARLTPEAEAVAQALSVLGDEASIGHVSAVADLDGQAVSRAADRLAQTSLLRPEPPLSFLHPLLAAAVRATIRGHRRREMKLRAAAFDDRIGSAPPAEAPPPDGMIDGSTAPQGVGTVQAAIASTLRGEPRAHVVDLALLAWQESLLGGELVDPSIPALSAAVLLAYDELELCLEIAENSRLATSLAHTPEARAAAAYSRSWALYHQGRVGAALAAGQAALGSGPALQLSVAHGALGAVAASLLELGRLDDAAAALSMLLAPDEVEPIDLPVLLDVRAQLHVAQSRPAVGLQDALQAGRLAGTAHPGIVAWRSTAALCHLSAGRAADAERLAREELELAQAADVTRVVIRDLRILARATQNDQRLGWLEMGVELGRSSPPRLEYARTLVDLGSVLRRANQRARARKVLMEAIELCGRLQPGTLSARAEAEFTATDSRPRAGAGGRAALTLSERRVAQLAASGRTTRQMATELFITPKTVEFHLRHIYGKLGIPSTRAELTKAMHGELSVGGAEAS